MRQSKIKTLWQLGVVWAVGMTLLPLSAEDRVDSLVQTRFEPGHVFPDPAFVAERRLPRRAVMLTGIETDSESEAVAVDVDADTDAEMAQKRRARKRKIQRTSQLDGEDVPQPAPIRSELRPQPGPAFDPAPELDPGQEPTTGQSWFESCCQPCCDLSGDPCLQCCFGQRLLIPRLGVVMLHRSAPRDDVLIFNPFDTSQAINAKDFNLGWGFGLDAGLTFLNAFSPGNDLELRYWGINDWSDQRFLHSTGLTTQINANPPILVGSPQDVTATLATQLNSFEANWRHRWEDRSWAFTAGFRSIELDDRLDAVFVDPTGVLDNSALHIHTRNRLYGAQVGLDAPLINNCRVCVRGFAKAGLFGNATANSGVYRCNCVPSITYRAGDTSDRVSMLAEAGLNGRLAFGKTWWLTGQYQAMYLGGVSTATDQLSHTNFTTGTGLNSHGGVFYHGGMLGVERAF